MNSDFLRWLLNVRVIPKGSESLRLAWEYPWAPWLWALLIIGAGLFAAWSYHNLVGRRTGRGMLASARLLLLLLVLVLISGPMLELPRETVERDWVIMLADRSASMTIKDANDLVISPSGNLAVDQSPNGEMAKLPNASRRISRDEQLRQSLESQSPVLKAIADQKHLVWMGFHSGAFNLATESEPLAPGSAGGDESQPPRRILPNLDDPTGRRTNIEAALEQALQRAAARPVSGIVVMSDGRSEWPARVLRRLQADKIPVYVVPLGSPEPLGDLAIRRVEAPRRAFVRDKVPVIVEVEGRGLDHAANASGGAGPARVKLIDQQTSEVLDEQDIDLSQLAGSESGDGLAVTLTAEPELAGEANWVAIVERDGASGSTEDLIPENNLRPMEIELIDRPLRVLYVDGYPRWEYRYVKNLLVREKTVESSVMLISADRDFAQEGNQPITRLPRSSEEFAAFDVIILGDVPATFFSPQQLDMIRAHVAERGAGLLWIAGPRSMPSSYAGTALADLLPMRGSLKLPAIGEQVTMAATALAERLGVLRLQTAVNDQSGWPTELADPGTGWSRLFYAQRIEPGLLKPAAEVLAQTVNAFGGTQLPLVINMRYGAGQSIYVATDEIWRWRYGRGELLHEQFWVQMIRMLGRESLITGGEPAQLDISPRRVEINQPMRIELRLLDSQLVSPQRTTVRVALENANGQRIGELELQRVEGTDDRFAAVYLPDTPGDIRVKLDDASLGPALRVQAPAEVFAPDDELQKPQTDHDLLRNLAESTGGRVLAPDEFADLSTLPNRAVKTINPLTEPIWDSPLALILALVVLTMEWVGRKVLRLA